MNLWQRIPFGVKLIGSFLVIVLLSVGVSSWFARDAIINVFEEAAAQRCVEAFYQIEGGWQLGPESLRVMNQCVQQHFMLIDSSGRVLFTVNPQLQGIILPADQVAKGIPVIVHKQRVGTVFLESTKPGQPPLEAGSMSLITRAILLAGLATALLAALLGVLLVRQVTSPLRALARASEEIAGGELSHRVTVRGEDELGQLGHSFNRMASNLERSEQVRRQMLADISHELRTPLMIIQGGLEAFMDDVLAPSKENLSALHSKTLLLNRLVDDLHELALAEAGELSLDRVSLDLSKLLPQIAAAIKPQLTERQINLVVDLPESLPPIKGDPQRIEQVLLNLFSNAMRYTPEGGRITLRALAHPDAVQIDVVDTGQGISPEDLPHVFERFYRGDKSRARASGGAGLGLAIAQALVTAHGGKIWAESLPGQGATFSFTLPY